MPSLDTLPPELYSAILATVPVKELQQAALSLIRAIPRSPVPQHHLFTNIRLVNDQSVIQLYRRLRGAREDALWVKELRLEAWTFDAEIVINLLDILNNLTSLTLFIGPNFAPEHLEEILEHPRPNLKYLAFRFKPYVQKATYFQFLKGAYFDSSLTCLSNWPVSSLPTLSLVQDPLEEAIAQRHKFAQPLVFFSLEGFIALSQAPYLSNLTSLRLRVPSRSIAPFICLLPRAFPCLQILDMSTCNVKISEMESLLVKFDGLQHLILDRCSLIQRGEDSEWLELGKACALAGLLRARECEKDVKSLLEKHKTALLRRNEALDDDNQLQAIQPEVALPLGPRSRGGRRGIANATISLRRSPTRSSQGSSRDLRNPGLPPPPVQKVRILPPPPSLISLCTTAPPSASNSIRESARQANMRAEFTRGWREGLATLAAIYKRLRASKANGVRVMRLCSSMENVPQVNDISSLADESFSRMKQLTDVAIDDPIFHTFETGALEDEQPDRIPCPYLCFAGHTGAQEHFDNCGHIVARKIWKDE